MASRAYQAWLITGHLDESSAYVETDNKCTNLSEQINAEFLKFEGISTYAVAIRPTKINLILKRSL